MKELQWGIQIIIFLYIFGGIIGEIKGVDVNKLSFTEIYINHPPKKILHTIARTTTVQRLGSTVTVRTFCEWQFTIAKRVAFKGS